MRRNSPIATRLTIAAISTLLALAANAATAQETLAVLIGGTN